MAAVFGELKTKEERRQEREDRERKQEILIAKFEQNPVLYDKQNEFYKDSKKRASVVKEIADILNWTPSEVLVCWRNLRDRYKKEKNLMELEKSGAGARKRNPWKFFENLKFLDTHFRRRRSLCTTNDEDEIDCSLFLESSLGSFENSQSVEEGNNVLIEVDEALLDENSFRIPSTSGASVIPETPKAGAQSQGLTPSLEVLSPKKGRHASRSRAKKDAELDRHLKKALSQLDELVKPEEKGPNNALCVSLNIALDNIRDEARLRMWRKKLRGIINDIEDGLDPDQSF